MTTGFRSLALTVMGLTYLYKEVLVSSNLNYLKSLQLQNTFAQPFFSAEPLPWPFKKATGSLCALEGYHAKWKTLFGEETGHKLKTRVSFLKHCISITVRGPTIPVNNLLIQLLLEKKMMQV